MPVAHTVLRADANIVRPDVPSGASLALPRYKADQEIDILFFYVVLQILPTRAAGGGKRKFFSHARASFFNLPSQALKVYAFAPRSAKTVFSRGAPRGSKGFAP